MFESFQRSLDRELGPADGVQGRSPARDPWTRDWPLLLGLVLSAALVAASMTLGPPSAAQPKAAPSKADTAAGAGVDGEVADVGESEAPAPSEPKKQAGKAKKATRAQPKAGEPAGEDDAAPAAEAGGAPKASTGGSHSSPRRRSARSQSSAPSGPARPGRIVNVTGTSAALTNGPLSYSFAAPTHTPTVGRRWRLSIAAKRSGAPLTGSVKVDILHEGTVVGHAASGRLEGGRFAHDLDWPERSVGFPLTVKTTVSGGGLQQSFLFTVKVKSAG